MFKNAGSTFDWSLRRSFGSGFIDHRDDEKMRSGQDYFHEYIESNPNIKAVSSHHVKMPLPVMQNITLHPVLFFRNPLERVVSVYEFERKQVSDTPGAVNAKRLNFSDYVKWRMKRGSGATIRNFQTRCCIGKITKPGLDLTSDDYNDAKSFLKKVKLIGLVEKYTSSMVLFEEEVREIFPELDLAHIRQNVNQSLSMTTNEKIDSMFARLDSEATELLLDNNKYDLLLYNYARSIICKKLEKVSDLEHKMNEFKSRCSSV